MIQRNIVTYRALFLAPLICQTLFFSTIAAQTQPGGQMPQAPINAPNVSFQQTSPFPFLANDGPGNTPPSVAPGQPATAPNIKPIEGELQKPTAAGDKKEEGPANIYLNFDNVSLASIVNYMGEQKKINLLPHKDIEAVKVSLSTRKPLTLERAWNVMLTLLEMNGFSIIKVTTKKGGDLYRVVSNKENGQVPLPTYSSATGTEPESLPDTDVVIRYIYFFKNIKADMAQNILSKMLDDGAIIPNANLNVLIIKEKSMSIKAAMKIAKELDNGGLREAIEMIPLTWVSAETIEKLFKDILASTGDDAKTIKFSNFGQNENTYFSSNTKIYSEPAKNIIILLGNKKNIDRIREFIYKNIDVPIDAAESRLHIKEIRYAKAEDIAPLLTDIIKVKTTSDKAVVAEGGYKVFEDVIISCEKSDVNQQTGRGGGNRLIIACNKEDWKRLEAFIEKIDKPQPQVAIEVMLINVNLSQDKELGAQEWALKGKMPKGMAAINGLEFLNLSSGQAKGTGGVVLTNTYLQFAETKAVNPLGLGDNSTFFATLGRPGSPGVAGDNIWSIIRGRYYLDNSHIISQPSVVANNNQECVVDMSDEQLVDGGLDSQKGELARVTKEKFTAKSSIKLTPRINYSGVIDLKIDVSLEEIGSDIKTKISRQLSTKASMSTGEVLVLGGLTNSQLVETIYKTPILGDIPIIGLLFRNKIKTKTENNLYIFIRPSIIRPRFEGNPDEYTQLKLDYAKYQIMKNDTYATEKDPIQRWFFKPTNLSIKQKLADHAQGVLRPVDEYAYGMHQPKSVNIQEDPYFKGTEDVERFKQRRESRKKRDAALAQGSQAGEKVEPS